MPGIDRIVMLLAEEKNIREILDSFMNNKPLAPGSYRNRNSSAPEKEKIATNGSKNA